MKPDVIADILKDAFGEAVVDAAVETMHPSVTVVAEKWHEIALFLRNDERLGINFCRCVSGVDWPEAREIEVVFDLMSVKAGHDLWAGDNVIAVKIRVQRDDGHMPSVADVWPTAEWHEREVFDLLGVRFDNHPDMRRILCPEDWVGHPLRKDYEYPLEYHGIPGTTEYTQQSPKH
jgi:NADH-quinone oxidoreductase subunit C